jgi:hypothetical protein
MFDAMPERITLHGLGFIQIVVAPTKRIHVWRPDIPRRKCYAVSRTHNHRFSFKSTVLVGTLVNRRYEIMRVPEAYATHDMVSHAGERLGTGARRSFVDGHCRLASFSDERVESGRSYYMDALAYHETLDTGVVVTFIEKLHEGETPAHSIIARGHTFDQTFDRFQWSRGKLWSVVVAALGEVERMDLRVRARRERTVCEASHCEASANAATVPDMRRSPRR